VDAPACAPLSASCLVNLSGSLSSFLFARLWLLFSF